MVIKIVQAIRAPESDLRSIDVDLTRKTGVLIRQSSKGADLEYPESRLRQESLIPVAAALRGDPDLSNIILYDEGSGVSGTQGYDERPELSRLYLDIANGVIGSIVVARADRLFRDKHSRNVTIFIELAERKGIKVIVPGRTFYDLTKPEDVQAFQRELREAYNYIASQVAYMQDMRRQKIARGLYGGGNLPAPYAIERSADKDERLPVIYHPWLGIAIDLFERFREYDYIQARVAHYIEAQPYIFPYPSAQDLQRYMFHTLMHRNMGGYTFTGADSIRKYLSNLTLGGFAKVGRDAEGNVLFLANAFEAAIPMELLWPSIGAITGHYPDGTPFESKRQVIHTHARKPSLHESPALLHGVLASEDGLVFYYGYTTSTVNVPIYACNKDMIRDGKLLKGRSGIVKRDRAWSVACEELDRFVVHRLCDLSQYDCEMTTRIKRLWEQRKSEGVNHAHILKLQIEKAEEQIRRLDKLLTDPAAPLSADSERRYLGALKDTEDDSRHLRSVLAKHQIEMEGPTEIVADFYAVLSNPAADFARLSLESQKQVVRHIIRNIQLNRISSHLFLLQLQWHNGIAIRADIALVWRGKGARIGYHWSPEEEEALRASYPYESQLEIMRALPRRGWQSIRHYASKLNLRRINYATHGEGINPFHETMSYDDLVAVSRLVNDPQQQERLREVTNMLARQTARGGLSAHWWFPLDAISYAGGPTARDDNELPLFGSPSFPPESTGKTDSDGHEGIFIASLES